MGRFWGLEVFFGGLCLGLEVFRVWGFGTWWFWGFEGLGLWRFESLTGLRLIVLLVWGLVCLVFGVWG